LGFGGELPGAAVWVNEVTQKRPKWRGFWNSLTGGFAPSVGSTAGSNVTSWLVVATGTLFASTAFTAGWRIVFYVGAVMLLVALYMRLRVIESPAFLELVAKHQVKRVPSAYLIRHFPGTLLKLIALGMVPATFFIISTFTAGFLTSRGFSATLASSAVAIGLLLFTCEADVVFGILTRWVNVRLLFAMGTIGSILFIFPYFFLMQTGVWWYATLGVGIFGAIIQLTTCTWPTIFPDYISTEARASGVGLGFQIGVMLSGGLLPFIAADIISVVGGTGNAWPYISAIIVVYDVIALIALILLPESKKVVEAPWVVR
jgi:MFS family permease